MAYNWNWQIFLQPSATGEGTYIDWLLQGLQWTLMLSLSSWVIALLVGSLVGVLRTVPNRWLSGLATCNAARSSTGTGFAGIANLPAHPLLRACCLQSARSANVRPYSRPRPLLRPTLGAVGLLRRPKTSR